MAGENTLSTLNGLFKRVYADKIQDLIPSNVVFQKYVPFVPASKEIGENYNQPVILADEHGRTFSNSGDAFSLNDAVAGQVQNAQVAGFEFVLRGRLSYAAASRAAQGRNAFVDATSLLVKNMRRSAAKTLEVEMMYGSSSIGQVASVTGDVVTLETAEWADGIWAGSVGMPIDFYDTKTGGSLQVSTKVVSVSTSTKSITVTSGDGVSVAAGDFVYFAGAYGKEMTGLHEILSNTGTLFGINAANYDLWTGNTFSVNSGGTPANLSFSDVSNSIEDAIGKGLDAAPTVMVNSRTWTDLMNNQNDSLRRVDSSYSASGTDQGTEKLRFYTQLGQSDLVPSIFCKEGYAYVINTNEFTRPGSSDVTFNRPGQTDQFFMDLENAAGYELRAYFDQSLFTYAPGHQVLIDNIVNG